MCLICRCKPRSMAVHLSTARHRRATTPRMSRRVYKVKSVSRWDTGTGWDRLPDEAYA